MAMSKALSGSAGSGQGDSGVLNGITGDGEVEHHPSSGL